ncbi:MAG: sigma-54 dependent transcriptional regulator [Bacteroidales bacterium]
MKPKPRILVVDDNSELLSGLKLFLSPHAEEIIALRNPNLIPATMQQNSFDLVLLDMNFTAGVNTGNEGLYWMKRIHESDPNVALVMITAYGDIELAVKAIKEGAVDFIQKSWDEERILSTLLAALNIRESRMAIKALTNQKKHLQQLISPTTDLCFGRSPAMQDILRTVEKVAATDANILILGENGSGKEMIARYIHYRSTRSSEMMVTVDLASLAETLFESELFGYRKGAFTDAKTDKSGYLELADKGTLFLDEIGNLSLPIQAKILSVLQNREFTPLGSVNRTEVDLRLISATNKDLAAMVEEGSFRQDLLYRLNTIQIELPPLRERKEDIHLLARFFLKKYAGKYGKNIQGISQAAINKLSKHSWPGNIRELQHTIEKAVILTDKSQLAEDDFSFGIKTSQVADNNNFNLADNEKQLIARAIEKHRGNLSHTAKSLGINRSTLYEKIRRYGL